MAGTRDHSTGATSGSHWGFSDDALERLDVYVRALLVEGRSTNLTAAASYEEALSVLVRPSLGVHQAWRRPRPPRRALDLGSGNGFPGVAVALLWPTAHVFLVERRGKKARAIRSCLEAAGITNAEALSLDVREVRRERPEVLGAIDLVTVRAVGVLDRTTRMVVDLLAPGGRIVHWKAVDLDEAERAAGIRVAGAAGLSIEPELLLEDAPGRLVGYARPETDS